MMDPVSAVGSALGSVKAALEVTKVALGAKVDAEIRSAVSDVMSKLIDVQTQLLDARLQMHDLIDENRKLKRELEERAEWKDRASKYRLVHTPGGAMLYQFQGEPSHYACPTCFEKQQIQVLHEIDPSYGRGMFDCVACKHRFTATPQ